VPVRWDDAAARWPDAAGVVVRSTWDYFERMPEFLAWLDRLERDGVRTFNPVAVIRENLDKTYLRALAAGGAPVVPTVWLEKGDLRPASELLADVPWDDVVVKPSVSAGAWRTRKTTRRALLEDGGYLHEVLRDSHALVQPFLREVAEEGEWSFVYFGGRFSHAVVKRAKEGDFRVQWTHGGTHRARTPSDSLRRQADGVAARLPRECLFARVDGVDLGGRFTLMEVEMIEPYLFLGESEGSAERFAAALAERLGPK
jgi:glutathione synthase/RimK-type ligase-like ATP-grasp enzyme